MIGSSKVRATNRATKEGQYFGPSEVRSTSGATYVLKLYIGFIKKGGINHLTPTIKSGSPHGLQGVFLNRFVKVFQNLSQCSKTLKMSS
jgi:hypothetical protein